MKRLFKRGALPLLVCAIVAVAAATAEAAKPAKGGKKKETVITAVRMEYDYAESAILFEENVRVADEEYTLTADRVIVMLDGTNEVRQIRALGHVALRRCTRRRRG